MTVICVYKHIYNFLLENRIISSNQSGFTPDDSAINQLLYITNEFGKALDDGKEVRVVFCDVSKARLVSSANNFIDEFMSATISLI
jgi:hypothetical protein